MAESPRVIVFDVNETLSDLSPMQASFESIGAPPSLAPIWFAGVLRDGFALTISGAPAPFADVAAAVLRPMLNTVPSLNRSLDAAVDSIMGGFAALSTHPDVVPGITRLAAAGHRMVTLTNGATAVADGLLSGAGVREAFAELLSVSAVGPWKPARAAYDYAAAQCGVEVGDLMLVAVHPWDIDGAHRAGLRTAWIDRNGGPYPAVFADPEITVPDLVALADALG